MSSSFGVSTPGRHSEAPRSTPSPSMMKDHLRRQMDAANSRFRESMNEMDMLRQEVAQLKEKDKQWKKTVEDLYAQLSCKQQQSKELHAESMLSDITNVAPQHTSPMRSAGSNIGPLGFTVAHRRSLFASPSPSPPPSRNQAQTVSPEHVKVPTRSSEIGLSDHSVEKVMRFKEFEFQRRMQSSQSRIEELTLQVQQLQQRLNDEQRDKEDQRKHYEQLLAESTRHLDESARETAAVHIANSAAVAGTVAEQAGESNGNRHRRISSVTREHKTDTLVLHDTIASLQSEMDEMHQHMKKLQRQNDDQLETIRSLTSNHNRVHAEYLSLLEQRAQDQQQQHSERMLLEEREKNIAILLAENGRLKEQLLRIVKSR
eukprot:GILK01005507.1.p1 GENE.GILK01005507.1~~GILK01005507.1.p1  ORF type:complete len:373 (-),score=88.37 GILK01005507.1:204-1322(-)